MSTIKVNSIVPPNVGEGVTIDGLQMPTAGALSNRNLVINGAMQVAQRGTSSTSIGYQTVDRYKSASSGIAHTQSQNTITSGAPYDEGFRYSFKNEVTSAFSGGMASWELQTRLEAQTIAQSGWNYKDQNSFITWSFWVKSSQAGTFYSYMFLPDMVSSSAAKYYRFPVTVAANTWTKVTKSIPGDSNLVVNNDNGNGLTLNWVPHYGSTFTGSNALINTWDALTNYDSFPDYAQNWGNTVGATFEVTGVQLEVGSKATPFEHRSYGDEFRRCARYYQVLVDGTGNPDHPIANPTYYNSSAIYGAIRLPVEMRSPPSFDTVTGTSYYISYSNNTNQTGSSIVLYSNSSTRCVEFSCGLTSSGTAGQSSIFRCNSTSAYLAAQAEL